MERAELIESVAAYASGFAAAICYSALFIAMYTPVAETLNRLVS
jgi:hypothetical protein